MNSSEGNDAEGSEGGRDDDLGNDPATNDDDADADDSQNMGDDTICMACIRKRSGGKPYKHGHAPMCEKSIYYGLSEEQINAVKEERSNKLKDTKENVLRRMGLSAKDSELKFPEISSEYPKVCDIPASLSSRHLSALVNSNDANQSKAPKAVTIILRYLQMLAPSLKKGTNEVIEHEDNMQKMEFFRGIFPRGCVSFTVPKEDPTTAPNPEYRIAEECVLHLVRWELHTDEILKCPFCEGGKLMYKKVAFSRTAVKPIIDIDGKLAWAVGSTYRCVKCDTPVHATDPELLQSLPTWMQQAYPVDNAWINKIKTFQIGRRLGALTETLLVGEGYDGNYASFFLRKLYERRYRMDHQLMVEGFEMHGESGPTKEEWTFDKWTGEFTLPIGDFLREAFDFSRTDESHDEKKKSSIRLSSGSPPRGRAIPSAGYRPAMRSPVVETVGVDPVTPSKRAGRPEDYSDHHHKQPRTSHPSQHMVHHTLEPLPPPPMPMFAQGRGPMSPGNGPHTPPGYGGHQWPGYGPGPPFPMHYTSPPQPPPPPPRYHHGYGYAPPTPRRKSGSTPTKAIPTPPSHVGLKDSKGEERKS